MCKMSNSYTKFSELLTEKKITTAQVARETGISDNVFSNWKNRSGNLTVENLAKVARYLGVPMDYFVSEGGDT